MRKFSPFFTALLIFLLARPVFAQISLGDQNPSKVNTGVEVISGYQRVFLNADGNKKIITEDRLNSFSPATDGKYVVWVSQINGQGQIFLYNISTDQTIQITSTSTNLNPRISAGKIVWEGWVKDKWQIFLFDGLRIKQITLGDVSFNPDIEGGEIVFARQNNKNVLRAEKYIISEDKTEELGTGFDKRYPDLRNLQVMFPINRVEETDYIAKTAATKAQPIATAFPQVQVVTEKQVKEEIGVATSSAAVSPSPSSTPIPSPPLTPTPVPSILTSPSSTPSATPVTTPSPKASSSAAF